MSWHKQSYAAQPLVGRVSQKHVTHKSKGVFPMPLIPNFEEACVHATISRDVSCPHGVTCLTFDCLNRVCQCHYQVAIGRLRGRTKETTKAKRPSKCVYIDRGGKPVNILFDAHCVKLPVRHTGEQPSSDVMGRPSYVDNNPN